jgi:hypothetical protein
MDVAPFFNRPHAASSERPGSPISEKHSILVIDCGTSVTRAHLLGRVDGHYRYIAAGTAPSTLLPPWNDLMPSVRQAVDQVTKITGHNLLDDRGQIIRPDGDGAGVEQVVSLTSASEPLRVVVTGPEADPILGRLVRELSYSGATAYLVPPGSKGNRTSASSAERHVNLIRQVRPDAIVLAGSAGRRMRPALLQASRDLALACSALAEDGQESPRVIYAGGEREKGTIANILAPHTDLHFAEGMQLKAKEVDTDPLHQMLAGLHLESKMERLPGIGTLGSWSSAKVQTSVRGFAQAIHHLAQSDGLNAIGVDIGGASTIMALSGGRPERLVRRDDLGLGAQASVLLQHVRVAAIQRWLPFEMSATEIRNNLHNKTLAPQTVPQTHRDLLFEQAVARELLRISSDSLFPEKASRTISALHLIVGSGGVLTHAPSPSQAAMILIDGLQPVGVSTLALDRLALLPSIGALLSIHPEAATHVLAQDALLTLGAVVAPQGQVPQGEPAITCRVEYPDGRSLTLDVVSGSMRRVPVPSGQTVRVELYPDRRFDLGLGRSGQAGATQVHGGPVGLIIDARGRPLSWAGDLGAQQRQTGQWMREVGD